MRYTLGTGRPSLGAKLGLADDFLPNFFLMTPPGNGTVGNGTIETFWKPALKSAKIRRR